MKTDKYGFQLKGPEISQMETFQRDLIILKNILKELNRVNHGIIFVIGDCKRAINEIEFQIKKLAGESYLKGDQTWQKNKNVFLVVKSLNHL